MEETFGPIIPIVRAPDDDEALIALSNSTRLRPVVGRRLHQLLSPHAEIHCRPAGRHRPTSGKWPGYRIEMSPFGGIQGTAAMATRKASSKR